MKKGISLVILVIVIIIMSILAGIVVVSGSDSIESATINTFALEILNVQTAVNEYYYRHGSYPSGNATTINVSNIASGSLPQFNQETIINNSITLKIVNLSLIGINETEFGNKETSTDVYAVSENTGKVYYLTGVKYEGKVYYTITDELYAVGDITNVADNTMVSSNEIKKYDVVFTVNNTKPTNQPVLVTIKLPSVATINSITTTGSKSVSNPIVSNGYNVITINETSTDNTGNYDIYVTYTYGGRTKTVTYSVSNFDNIKPTIGYTEDKSGDARIITVTTSDDGSGINTTKYDLSEITDSTYFQNYGKVLSGNTLVISKNDECTIYVEDKAGNSNMLVIPLA